MIFTIGRTSSYDAALEEKQQRGEPLLKLGRTDEYVGGVVFHSTEDAEIFLKLHETTGEFNEHGDFSVYGLMCEWDNTYPLNGENYLINSAEIVSLDRSDDNIQRLSHPKQTLEIVG